MTGTSGSIAPVIFSETYNDLADGVSTMPRGFANAATSVTATSQALILCYFTSVKSFTTAQIRVFSSGTAAGATPTLVRLGLYEIDASENGTLIASTVSDTALFSATSTVYTKSWSAPVAINAGRRYAAAWLCVTAAAAPTLPGQAFLGGVTAIGSESSRLPRMAGQITAQADLPASFLAGAVASLGGRPYAAIIA